MSVDDNNRNLQPWIEPGIEARVVAWVLGEASAFETAELERILVERPELAVFKRKIEAVHALVAEAARPAGAADLRLSPSRRQNVLAAIGKPADRGGNVAVLAESRSSGWRAARRILLPAAACLVLLAIIVLLSIPAGTNSLMKAPRTAARIEPRSTSGDERNMAAYTPASPQPVAAATPSAAAMLRQREASGQLVDDVSSGEPMGLSTGPGSPQLAQNVKQATAGSYRKESAWGAAGGGKAAAIQNREKASPDQKTVTMPLDDTRTLPAPPVSSEDKTFAFAGGIRAGDAILEPAMKQDATATATLREEAAQNAPRQKAMLSDFPLAGALRVAPEAESATRRGADSYDEDRRRSDFFGPSPAKDEEEAARKTEAPSSTMFDGSINYGSPIDSLKRKVLAANPNAPGTPVFNDDAGRDRLNAADTESFGNDGKPREAQLPPANESSAPAESAPTGTGLVKTPQKVAQLQSSWQPPQQKQLEEASARRPLTPGPAAPDEQETPADRQPFSTFSLHVSDASFRLAQAALAKGEAPDPGSIRPEEFYNAFDYGDPSPARGEKVACRIEQCADPALQQRNLVRIALKTASSGRAATQPLRLTVLLDTSGSMEREDRAAALRNGIEALASLLGPSDLVTVIGFARQPRMLADRLPGDQAGRLSEIVRSTPNEGGTNLEEALKLAAEHARKNRTPGAQNRIVLFTDGAANLGDANPAQLGAIIQILRQQGIAFDACGVGTEGVNDEILEALTRKGDGRYCVLNASDAGAAFARQLAGAFRPAAENVKVQVRFNPARAGNYRLIGFQKHKLRKKDFRNDRVDAAELASEEAGVALYHVEVLPDGEGELGEVFVRFRNAETKEMVERSWTIPFEPNARAFDQAAPSLQLAGTSAYLAEKLRGGAAAARLQLSSLAPVIAGLRERWPQQARVVQLASMFDQLRRMEDTK